MKKSGNLQKYESKNPLKRKMVKKFQAALVNELKQYIHPDQAESRF